MLYYAIAEVTRAVRSVCDVSRSGMLDFCHYFFFQAEDGIRDFLCVEGKGEENYFPEPASCRFCYLKQHGQSLYFAGHSFHCRKKRTRHKTGFYNLNLHRGDDDLFCSHCVYQ